MDKEKILVKSQWDEKYIRENPLMPFGSMCNSYGLINEGKGISTEDFLVVADKLKEKSIEIIKELFDLIQKSEDEVDFKEKE